MTFSFTYYSDWRVSHSYSRTIRSTLLTAFIGSHHDDGPSPTINERTVLVNLASLGWTFC